MPTFTVHAPPPKTRENAANPERFVFVRDGFYFWAFVLAPLWLLQHRLWLLLLCYILLNGLIMTGLYFIGAPAATKFFVGLVLALLIGFEAATLWRWTLARRGWQTLGFSIGDDVESAEQQFFAAWATRMVLAPPPPPPPPERFAAPTWRGPPAPSDVIGLFPEPGGKP